MATAMADETPPYSFVAKNGQVAWDAVMGFDLAPFLSGQNVAPYALAALDDLSRQLEEARIEPDPGVNPETNADRLARLAVVLQLSSEYQAMRAEDLQVAVEKKDRELDVMDEQMEQLERGGARTDTSLEAEADAARSRAEEAERRMSLQTQELEALKEQLERHVAETRESKRALDEASSRARAAEDDVKEMQERLANETRKMQAKMREDTTAAQRASQRNQEVARYQKENAMLADENQRLAAKIETLMAECVGYSETIVRLDDAAQAWRGKEADVEAAAEAIRRERDQLAAQLETTQSDLEERTEMLMTFEERFAEEHASWKRERAELEEEAARLRHTASMERERAVSAAGAAGDSPTGSVRGVLASPRRQHAMSRARSSEVRGAATNGLHPDDPRYVEELEAEVAELRDLRVLLLEAYDQLEKDVGREIDIALQRQNRHHANLEAKVSMQDEALRQEHKRFKSMDRALAEAQDELAEASRRNAEYEQGVYGLSEAMRDLKALRLQVRAADQQVQDAVETSNELGRKVEDLTEETRFLRQKAGIPEDADIDLGDFKIRSKVEAAQLRALNAQLEHEVHELEEDRRRLRNELRYRAKWQGEHAAKLGLSARQLAMLEEFADALRFGQETSFSVEGEREGDEFSAQRAVDNINARAVNELEEANRHLQERLAEALERARRNGVDVDAPRVNAPLSRAGDAQQAQQAQAQAQFEQQQAQLAQAQSQFEQQQQARYAQEQAQLEQQQQAQQQRDVEQAAQQAQARGQDPVAAAAAMLALSQQAAAAQQQQLQQQYQAQFEQQQAQWQQAQARAPQTVIERVVEPDPQSASQIAELQRQLQRARAEIVRLEDGYHDAMMRSSQNYSAASSAAATQAAAMAAATQAAAFAAMSQVSRPSTPPPAPTSTESSRPVSPLVPSLSDAIQRNAHNLLSKTRIRLQERLAEAARAKADAEAAERRAAEEVEAARRRAELESRDAATAESNAAAVAASAAALAEAQRAAAAAAAAADATASQFEQARAREHQAGQVAAEKAEETRAAQLEAEAAVRRAEEEARAAARRAEEEALAAARQAEEDARYARDQARSRAEDERVARNAAQAEAAQKALALQSEAAARALAEAQRAAMEATRAAMSAAQQLEEMRARQAVVPESPQLPPSPPAAAEPAARAPVPVASAAPAPPAPPVVSPARVPVASLAPPAEPSQSETTTTTTTTVVETIEAPTAAAITPAPAVTTPVYAVPVEQTRETVGLTINVTPPAEAPPALPRTTSGTQADLQVPPSPRRTSGTQADLQVPPSPRRTSGTQADLQVPPSPRRTSGTQADLQVPPSPRRNSGSQTADLPGASSVAPPQAAAAPAPAAAAVYHPSPPAPPAPAPVPSAPMATQSDSRGGRRRGVGLRQGDCRGGPPARRARRAARAPAQDALLRGGGRARDLRAQARRAPDRRADAGGAAQDAAAGARNPGHVRRAGAGATNVARRRDDTGDAAADGDVADCDVALPGGRAPPRAPRARAPASLRAGARRGVRRLGGSRVVFGARRRVRGSPPRGVRVGGPRARVCRVGPAGEGARARAARVRGGAVRRGDARDGEHARVALPRARARRRRVGGGARRARRARGARRDGG
jgi:centrosomal protein CEP290